MAEELPFFTRDRPWERSDLIVAGTSSTSCRMMRSPPPRGTMATQIALCATCAVETNGPQDADRVCPICADERQYLPKGGQRWTTVDELIARGHTVEWFEVEPDLVALTTKPGVGIGQQTMIARTPEGNLLWDPPGLITNEAVDHVRRLGRTVAIAASHPHMFGVQLAWAEVLNAPVLVNAKDADWLQRRDDAIEVGLR